MKQKGNLYEEFHQSTNIQRRVIQRGNFTYNFILQTFDDYFGSQKFKILDIGCGSGAIALYLVSKGHNVVGIDISTRAIKMCLESAKKTGLLSNVKFARGDFLKMKIENSFDVVVCFEVLEHIANDKKSISRIIKLLNSNGLLIISVPSKNAPLFKINYAKEFDKKVGHLRRYSVDEITSLFEGNKIKILKIYKVEGILRNFLFINKYFGLFIRILNKIAVLSKIFSFIDNQFLRVFGESNYVIVAKKNK